MHALAQYIKFLPWITALRTIKNAPRIHFIFVYLRLFSQKFYVRYSAATTTQCKNIENSISKLIYNINRSLFFLIVKNCNKFFMAGTIFFLLYLGGIKSQKERYRQINLEEKCELLKNEFEVIFLPKKETPLSNSLKPKWTSLICCT